MGTNSHYYYKHFSERHHQSKYTTHIIAYFIIALNPLEAFQLFLFPLYISCSGSSNVDVDIFPEII